MNWHAKLKRMAAMALVVILVLYVQPMGAEDESPERHTV